MRLLLVEDEKELARALVTLLTYNHYSVDEVYDGEQAVVYLENGNYDGVILDIMLPKLDGISVLKKIRAQGNQVPVLILSAKSALEDKVNGLDCGADDYLTKPFSVEELLARLRVTARRLAMIQANNANESIFRNGKLKVDYAAGSAYMGEEELHLTPIEYKLLCLLSQNVGKVLTHTFITQKIWGRSWDDDVASLRVFMSTLRKKIETGPESPQYIQTHIGVGYRMLKVE